MFTNFNNHRFRDAIIAELGHGPDITKSLAKKINASETTAQNWMNRLLDEGVVEVININKLGRCTWALKGVRLIPKIAPNSLNDLIVKWSHKGPHTVDFNYVPKAIHANQP